MKSIVLAAGAVALGAFLTRPDAALAPIGDLAQKAAAFLTAQAQASSGNIALDRELVRLQAEYERKRAEHNSLMESLKSYRINIACHNDYRELRQMAETLGKPIFGNPCQN